MLNLILLLFWVVLALISLASGQFHIPLEEIRSYVKVQLEHEIWDEEQRFYNPHKHYLDMSPSYYQEKMDLLHKIGR